MLVRSKLRFQIRHEDFRHKIEERDEDINSILVWYKEVDAYFLNYLSTEIKLVNSRSDR